MWPSRAFGRFWTRGIWQTSANDFSSRPAAAVHHQLRARGNPSRSFPAIGYTNYTSIYGGLLVDGCGVVNQTFNHWTFTELLVENAYIPAIRINNPTLRRGQHQHLQL